ncbi:MAG: hypothetical protein HY22_13795 [[Candidatus Thermochlorobacteriaceae] bacterium GBChlB]|nr:MAG: hypothetical protein HY22_13795 [[Candidatus Thermochlorobacteriaceae] bacterium GBChlB]
MSVSADIISKSLAPALGLDEATVEAWVSTALHRAVEELMLSGSVQLASIGILKKTHVPSEPHDFGDGKFGLMPPRARVELLSVEGEGDDGGFIYDVALGDLKLDEDAAEKFAKGFARVVEKVLEAKGSLALGRLGALIRSSTGELSFQESTWLGDFLNKPYKHLAPVMISGDDDVLEKKSSVKEIAPVAFKPSEFGLDSPPVPKKPSVQPDEFSFSAPKTAAEKKDDIKFDQDRKRERFQPPVPSLDEPNPDPVESAPQKSNSTYQFKVPKPIQDEPLPNLDALAVESAPSDTKRLLTIGSSTAIAVAFVVAMFWWLNQLSRSSSDTVDTPKPERAAEKSVEKKESAKSKTESSKTDAPAPEPTKVEAKKSEPPTSETKVEPKSEPPKPVANTGLPADLSTPVNESKGGWAIVVASRPSEAEAKAVAADFAKKGFATSIKAREVNGETRYRVRVGQFEKQADALKAIKQNSTLLPQGAFLDKIQ